MWKKYKLKKIQDKLVNKKRSYHFSVTAATDLFLCMWNVFVGSGKQITEIQKENIFYGQFSVPLVFPRTNSRVQRKEPVKRIREGRIFFFLLINCF